MYGCRGCVQKLDLNNKPWGYIVIVKVQYSWQRTLLITLKCKMKHKNVQCHFVREMVERKNVLWEKVDTLDNVADSLKTYVSTKKFSWCGEVMGIFFCGLLI